MMYRCDVIVRTQLQLTEEQIRALRLLSTQQNKSIGKSDISLNHDSYLPEAYAERES